jgi:thymidylate synthase
MTIIDERYIVASSLSVAWLDAVTALNAQPKRKAVHLLVRILDAAAEDLAVRELAQQLIERSNVGLPDTKHLPDIETTRNTIFPASFARRNPEPEDLAAYYRERYTKDGLLGFKGNERGTYFGRIVAYPRHDGSCGDQLSDTVRKLRDEMSGRAPKSSRYEISIYNEARDTSPMSFPCLAHLSVHLHEQRLHMQAIYRNELLVARGYGNFLGLAELQRYIATAAGVTTGELLMTIGHAELDARKRDVQDLLGPLTDHNELA